ncbi:DUF5638 domain-containing protein [Fluoribacter dumoffii]|uniref:DUF5638 domain-containing protein n=1 Tax=Fluoribacter dumoffii TaxID=463 RepID=A0A377GCI9_9GAMM|nr:DUF5638 domain-containing protein [Fluoribacter dumoffii]KTC90658.1 hypothetical protein Ldum_1726 [Fluoribacter dumoffii NY 23]MCW8386338.1 DUF5638 domain-containing protein [Fluoribacter dumoffii]MCW8419391.1 DUF5638 domain-containing protein [Fluoribacter dumoffii]MCW8452734.1 DUF5638 domain-containing protein [Fluoribacter dumoffii]MCW8460016.1 DUF5638 domain-containing protein [Fluoribacter dumoffii]
MPVNHSKFERRLNKCDEDLQALCDQQKQDQKIQQKINAVKAYYNLSYTKASTAKTVEEIVTRYESFVEQLTQVKNGTLSSQKAMEAIGSNSESRKLKVIFHDLAKAAEAMFYAATAFSLYAGIFGIALPVLIVQPLLGVAVGITIVGAMLGAAYKALACLTEFRSISRHDTEYNNESSLIKSFNFFKPELQRDATPVEEVNLESSCCF